ncbi:MAG: hypothetical protein GPJ27_07375 [Microcystis aeruginosa L111-01]|nr:hypothetical protein [Microcystis aeruginosa L111-01]
MDEDFVQALRSLNVDLLTVADVGMLHRSDEEQIDWARQNGRVIFSFNTRDFERLHTTLIGPGLSHRKFWVGNPAVLGWLYVRIKKTVSKTKWADSTLKTLCKTVHGFLTVVCNGG